MMELNLKYLILLIIDSLYMLCLILMLKIMSFLQFHNFSLILLRIIIICSFLTSLRIVAICLGIGIVCKI